MRHPLVVTRCPFPQQLKYYTQIHVRSTRGKNAQGRKITGIEPMPGEDKVSWGVACC